MRRRPRRSARPLSPGEMRRERKEITDRMNTFRGRLRREAWGPGAAPPPPPERGGVNLRRESADGPERESPRKTPSLEAAH